AGGIPDRDIDALSAYWKIFPTLRQDLFEPARPGYSNARVDAGKVKSTIQAHPEFAAFKTGALIPFEKWFAGCQLDEIARGDSPKQLIEEIGERLLAAYDSQTTADVPLLENYAIYQLLMDYWMDVMQDDVYVLSQDGWLAGKVLRELIVEKGEKLKEMPDLVIGKKKYKAELLPPALLVARYLASEQQMLDQLQVAYDDAAQALESFLEENIGDDGLLSDAMNDKEKVTAASIKARFKVATDKDEKVVLKTAQALFDAETKAKKAHKEAQEKLDLAVFAYYSKLTENDIKILLVQDKWKASLTGALEAEIERVTQRLANRVKNLEERYNSTLPILTQSVAELEAKVAAHLKAMGLE
ncbi:TPA: type I restriction endonuclease subunit M, partial [Citrobacter freundii]